MDISVKLKSIYELGYWSRGVEARDGQKGIESPDYISKSYFDWENIFILKWEL